ncbi:Coiled-coil domain-containing protein [Echinococcus granulosus]|nr:Coiled-coil domain-containing protein [Echinococcus granulosus]
MRKLAEVESEVNAIRNRMGKGSYFAEQEINLAQLIRTMENKLDKTSTKMAETIHIKHTYEAIRDKLMGESSTYTITLESMAAEIRQCSAKLTELKESSVEAVRLRDKALVELKEHEQLLFAHQKRQELELFNMKRTLNLLKEQPIPTKALLIDNDIEKSDEDDQLTGEDPTISDSQGILTQLEAIHSNLKAVTGVSNNSEIEKLFIQFEQSTASLRKLSGEVEIRVKLLRSQNVRLKEIFQELRSIGSAKISGNLTRTTAQARMDSLKIKMSAVRSELNKLKQLLTCVHMAVEHIYVKLQMTPSTTKGAKKQAAVILRHLVEIHLPDLMLQCLDYQDQLDNDLDDYNLAVELANMTQEESMKLMHTDQFYTSLKSKIPRYNTRIVSSWMKRTGKVETDEEDNAEWRSRNDLKHRSTYVTLANRHHPSKR